MWIRLPKQNASKTTPKSLLQRWFWWLKVLVVAACAVWAVGLWSRVSRSQDFKSASANANGSPSSTSNSEPLGATLDLSTDRPQMPIPASPPAREIGTEILHRTLLDSVWGAPTLCEVRQSIQFADKKRSSFGKYVRGGKGLGKMRMTLQIPAGDQMNSLLQVSDGDLLTTMVSVGDQRTMTQIDLVKVRERLPITTETFQHPVVAMYLAFGGQAEVLRTMCQKYDWTKVTEGQLGNRKVWWIRGIATAQPIGFKAEALVDQRLFQQPYDVDIPPNVKLAIGHRESDSPYWLYQVETWNDGDAKGRGKAYVLTEWDSPIRLSAQQMTPDLFQLGTDHSASDVREETKLYLPPLQLNFGGQASAKQRMLK